MYDSNTLQYDEEKIEKLAEELNTTPIALKAKYFPDKIDMSSMELPELLAAVRDDKLEDKFRDIALTNIKKRLKTAKLHIAKDIYDWANGNTLKHASIKRIADILKTASLDEAKDIYRWISGLNKCCCHTPTIGEIRLESAAIIKIAKLLQEKLKTASIYEAREIRNWASEIGKLELKRAAIKRMAEFLETADMSEAREIRDSALGVGLDGIEHDATKRMLELI